MLTFVVFVGVAAAAVWLYLAFVLQGDIDTALERMLREQAQRVVTLIEAAPDEEVPFVIREYAKLGEMHITAVRDGEVVWEEMHLAPGNDTVVPSVGAVAAIGPGEAVDTRITAETGAVVHYFTIRPQESALTVRVGQGEPRLLALVNRIKAALVVGMVLALALAVLGSWLAAQRVTVPLTEIRNSARRIAEGDFERKIVVQAKSSEFRDLEESLNRMSESFLEKIDHLQRMAAVQNEFIGNVSHEVRNPIFAVGGYVEALSSPGLTDEHRALYGEKALTNLQRLSNLFNDLIEIARLEYREDLLSPVDFDASELIMEVGDSLRNKAHDKGLDLEVENPILFVHADRNRIRQVVVNLIENAIAYSDEGVIRCKLAHRQDKVRIEVVDTGRGIDEQHLERVFERFYRVDPDRSRRSGGTGLGLSIVKQILQAHGQPIHVESTVGSGTRFWFELPFAPAPEEVEV